MVALRVKRAKDFRKLARSTGTSRLVGILKISKRSFRRARLRRAIRAAIRAASRRADLDLVVRPTGADSARVATQFVAQASAAAGDSVAPSRPANLRVASRTADSVTVAWSASQDDRRVIGYAVYADGVYVGTTTATTYRFPNLDCQTHLLEVDAYDRAGNRSAKSFINAAPTGCDSPGELPTDPGEPLPPPGCGLTCPDTTPPSQPSGLRTSVVGATALTFAWNAAADNVGVTGYRLYLNGSPVSTTTGTSATVSSLTCGTTYLAGIEALDAAGNVSTRGTLQTTTSPCPDQTAPSTPQDVSSQAASQTAVTLRWTAATDNVAVTGYRVLRDGTLIGTTTSTTYSAAGLTCGSSYSFAVEAIDAAGNRSGRGTATGSTAACTPTADTTPPSVPQGMAWNGKTQTSLGLRWDASTDNVGVAGYHLYRNGTRVASITSLSYSYTGLTCGSSYTMALEAYDAAGNVSNRAEASGTTTTDACAPGPDTQAPSAPGGLAKSGGTQTSVALGWSASTDNVGVSGYRVYRDGTLVASPTGTTQNVTGLTCGTTYAFGVEALDAAGNVSSRSALSAATSACAPVPDTQAPSAPGGLAKSGGTQTSVALGWSASTDNVGVSGYRVYRDGTLVASPTGTTQNVTGLTCGTTYAFGVEALDAAGNVSSRSALSAATSACAPVPDTLAPSVPGGMAFGATTQTSIALAWNASTDNVGVAGYRVYRDGQSVGTTTNRSYTFSGLTCGTTYSLGIEAYDVAGNVSSRAQATGSASTAACDPDPDPDPDPEPGEATRFVSTSGSDSGTCTQAAPCASFDRAYRVAGPGEVVQVAAGTYAHQRFVAVAGKTSPNIVFRPAAGARVILGGLSFGNSEAPAGPDYITVKGMETVYRTSEPGAGNQQGVWVGPGRRTSPCANMDAGSVTAWRAAHVTVKGGDYGPCDAVWGTGEQACGNSNIDASTNVLIDGATLPRLPIRPVVLHEGRGLPLGVHVHQRRRNNTIRNSIFRTARSSTSSRRSPDRTPEDGPHDLKIENNWFAAPWTETPRGKRQSRDGAVRWRGARTRRTAIATCSSASTRSRRNTALQSTTTRAACSTTSGWSATSCPTTVAANRGGRSSTTSGAPAGGRAVAARPTRSTVRRSRT